MKAVKKFHQENITPALRSKIYNIEAEQTVLGCLMNKNDDFSKVLDLEPEVFFEEIHQKLFQIMTKFYLEGKDFNPVLLKSYFDNDIVMQELGGANYLLKLCSVAGGVVSLTVYSDELKTMYRQRTFEALVGRYTGVNEFGELQSYVDMNTPIDEVLTEFEDKLFQPTSRIKIRTEKQVALDVASALEKDLPCYSTGIALIDKLLGGGLYQSDAYSLIARRKTGKTATLGTISHHLSKQGHKHMYIAIEMGAESIYRRIMGFIIGYNPMHFYDKLKRNQPDFHTKVCKLALETEGATIYAEAPGITFDELRRLILAQVRKHKLTGVIVDHLHIIGGQLRGESEAKFYGRVAQWLADVAKAEKIFTLTACQANDDGSVKWSKDILGAMDMNLYMYRPEDQKKIDRWFEVKDARNTISANAGSESKPAFEVGGKSVFLIQKDDLADFGQEDFLAGESEYVNPAREKEVKRKF